MENQKAVIDFYFLQKKVFFFSLETQVKSVFVAIPLMASEKQFAEFNKLIRQWREEESTKKKLQDETSEKA